MHAALDDKVAYHLWVTVTLTSDLISRLALSLVKYLLYSLFKNLVYECNLGWQSVAYHLWVTVILTSDLVFRIVVSKNISILFF